MRAAASAWTSGSTWLYVSRVRVTLRCTMATSHAGASRRTCESSMGSAVRCAYIVAAGVGLRNDGRPASASYSTTPSAYRSERASASRPARTSGAKYSGVPMSVPSWVTCVERHARDYATSQHDGSASEYLANGGIDRLHSPPRQLAPDAGVAVTGPLKSGCSPRCVNGGTWGLRSRAACWAMAAGPQSGRST